MNVYFNWLKYVSGEFGDLFVSGQYQPSDDDDPTQVNYCELF